MKTASTRLLIQMSHAIAQAASNPAAVTLVPALSLACFWLWGEMALLACALLMPLLWLAGTQVLKTFGDMPSRYGHMGPAGAELFTAQLEQVYESTRDPRTKSCLYLLEIDELTELEATHGKEATDEVLLRSVERIQSVLRDRDIVARLEGDRFAICLSPVVRFDLEMAIQLAGRMQAAIEEPFSVDGTTIFVSASIGLCLSNRAPARSAAAWQDAAAAALQEAHGVGAAGIRVYSDHTPTELRQGPVLREEALLALENGMIQAWFQPQICTDTGQVSGFEALARWSHPTKGMIPPSQFLPILEQTGMMQQLSRFMIRKSLEAITSWDAAGLKVPAVGVNFAADELRDPNLVERVREELDTFGLTADRLAVEILETVMTDAPDDITSRNIAALGEMGCRIDLDDFGTGHASIASVRRFRVSRIKIDRSFVTKADHDREQQRLIAAILTMAEQLELETLAEGVETAGEHALLAQLGCGHVQGFGIGRPMPFEQTLDWVVNHEAKLEKAPQIGLREG